MSTHLKPVSDPHCNADIRRPIYVYICALGGLFSLTWICVLLARYALHKHFPMDTPLFNPAVRFSDWTNFTGRVAHFGEKDMLSRSDLGLPYPYPLPSLYLYLVVVRLFHNSLLAYRVITILVFSISTAFFSWRVRQLTTSSTLQIAIWMTLVLGFPALFLYDRGNIEVFIWLLVMLGLVAYLRGWKFTAALLFAAAGAMKIYPAILLLLFLPRRQYKALMVGVAAAAVFSVVSLVAVGPNVPATIRQMGVSAQTLKDTQIDAVDEDALRFDHSVLGEEKQAIYTYLYLHHRVAPDHMPTFERSARVYSLLAPLAFLFLYLFRLRLMPLLNQFLALTLFSILLPYVSYEYTLVHVYLMLSVFLLFLLSDGGSALLVTRRSRVTLLMACFGVIVAPISFLTLTHYSGQLKGLVLILILYLVLKTPMPSSLFGDLRKDGGPSEISSGA